MEEFKVLIRNKSGALTTYVNFLRAENECIPFLTQKAKKENKVNQKEYKEGPSLGGACNS